LDSGTVDPNKPGAGGGANLWYHHLTPKTRYYLKLVATNASGTTTATHLDNEYENLGIESKYPEYFNHDWFATYPVRRPEVNGFNISGCARRETSGECSVEEVDANGAQATYHFEYSLPEGGHAPTENSPSWKPFTSGAEGTITVAEDFAAPHASVTGLTPETSYYVRVKAENEKGQATSVSPFESGPAKPSEVQINSVSNVSATSAHVFAEFKPDDFETKYRLEYTTEPGRPASWVEVPGGSGTIAAADATEAVKHVTANLTGLTPSTAYYVRLFARNEPKPGEPKEVTSASQSFRTAGPPEPSTFAVHDLHGETIRVLGSVVPNDSSTNDEQTVTVGGGATGGTFTLTFDGETTAPIAFDPRQELSEDWEGDTIAHALQALPKLKSTGDILVSENVLTASYTIEFAGTFAGQAVPQLTADASGLTPAGSATVATVQAGVPADSGYHFEYTTTDFTGCGTSANPACLTTPAVDVGTNSHPEVAYADLPGLQRGGTYHYRIVATNNTSGNPVVDGPAQTLAVPTPAAAELQGPCPNEALRTGPSAKLPDCRAYEQITPTEKRGAQDFDRYGVAQNDGAFPGYDGDHVFVHAPGVQWGSSADAEQANYLFARAEAGWRMTSVTPQPEAGLDTYLPALFSPDLTQVAVEVGWKSGSGAASPEIELLAGPPGGPYTRVASIPRSSVVAHGAFAAASADSSKYVFHTEDHKLLGQSTGTVSGEDLYEFSAGGGLRQVNVQGSFPGTKISACGAQVVGGLQAVSADGSRVFFTDNCTHHLYMRAGGEETVDIGEYTYLAGNADDSKLLLTKQNGEAQEVFLYETATQTAKHLPGARPGVASEDLSTIYFSSSESLTSEAPQGEAGLYRYDVAAGTLHFVLPKIELSSPSSISADGRYLYLQPGPGAPPLHGVLPGGAAATTQVYRLDTAENVIECVSCASAFDPEPRLSAFVAGTEVPGGTTDRGALKRMTASANGDYVFFDTPAALVPADVDGEIAPSPRSYEYLSEGGVYSPSSDVYEWRRNGVGGCAAVQGCLSLITTGQGNGLRNVLYGTDASGRDVFIGTHESLVPGDEDTAGDVYDARIGGGFAPPPPRPVECEGDACSTPASAPNDATPSSLTFSGAGNLLQPSVTKPVAKVAKPKPKKKPRKKSHRKKRKVRKATNGRGKVIRTSGRSK
jgi:hypothetical protein